jgi:hypothetical protein
MLNKKVVILRNFRFVVQNGMTKNPLALPYMDSSPR